MVATLWKKVIYSLYDVTRTDTMEVELIQKR